MPLIAVYSNPSKSVTQMPNFVISELNRTKIDVDKNKTQIVLEYKNFGVSIV